MTNIDDVRANLQFLHGGHGFAEKILRVDNTFFEALCCDPSDFDRVKHNFIYAINSISNLATSEMLLATFGLLDGYDDIPTLKKRWKKYGEEIGCAAATVDYRERNAIDKLSQIILTLKDFPKTTESNVEKQQDIDTVDDEKSPPSKTEDAVEHNKNAADIEDSSGFDNDLPEANISAQSVDTKAKLNNNAKVIYAEFGETNEQLRAIQTNIETTNHLFAAFMGKLNLKNLISKHKKMAILFVSIILIVALLSGVMMKMGQNIVGDKKGSAPTGIESSFDAHLVLQLENANHSYEMGLNSWRFMKYHDAEEQIKTALVEISELKSQSELDVAKINNSLGCLYLDMGNYSDETYKLLDGAYSAFDQESIESRAAKLSLAQYFYLKGDFESALQRTQEIIDNSDSYEEKAVDAATSNFRAKILDAQGKHDEALQLYKNVLTMYQDIYHDGKAVEELAKITNGNEADEQKKTYYATSLKWIMLTLGNIGEVYIHMQNYDEAYKVLKEAYKMCDQYKMYLGTKNPNAAKIATNMAIVLSKQGKMKEAVTWADDYSIRVQLYRYDFEAESPELVKSYIVFGEILEKQEKADEALEQFNNALNFAVEKFGVNHPKTAEANNAIGEYYSRQNNDIAALEHFEKALKIRRDILALEHPDSINIYLNLAQINDRENKIPVAAENALEAYKICIKLDIDGDKLDETVKLLRRFHDTQNITVPFDEWLNGEVGI